MKKLLLILGVPVAIILIAIAVLVFFVNPNQFKPLIVEQTKKQTGMDLVIEGDIEWQFFPSLGLSLGKTELKNPQGFGRDNLLKIEGIGVDVSVMPLLDKELFIGKVSLDGAEIYLETKKDGSTNLDALVKKPTEAKSKDVASSENKAQSSDVVSPPTAQSNADQAWRINLAGVSVTNAKLEIQNYATGSYTKLYDVGLEVSEFAFDQWTKASFQAKGNNNQQFFAAKGEAELQLSQDLVNHQLRNVLLDASFQDPNTNISSAKIELSTFAFDQLNPLTVAVKGNASGLDLDSNLASKLFVDKAMTQVRLDKMALDSIFKGDSLPQTPMKVLAKSDFSFDMTSSLISLQLHEMALNDIKLDGSSSVKLADIPKIRFDFHSPNIDLDALLGLNEKPAKTTDKATTTPTTPTEKKAASSVTAKPVSKEVEPDLSALKGLDIKGKVTIDAFKANNAKLEKVTTSFTVNRGIVVLNSFSANLYQGSIKATAKLDARKVPASYWVKKQMKGVKVLPLLTDVAKVDMLEGTGNIDVNASGRSLTPTGIQKNLVGTVKINFADGAVNGINVAQEIRVAYAKIKGRKLDESITDAKKTDFSALTATLKLNKGEVTSSDLTLSSPLLRIQGEGKANYIQQTMDMLLSTSIVGSLKGQGGKDIDDLRDITLPVRIYNTWTNPKYKIEFANLWKQLEKRRRKN